MVPEQQNIDVQTNKQKMQLEFYSRTYLSEIKTKIKYNLFKYLNGRAKTTNSGKKMKASDPCLSLGDLRLGNDFLDISCKQQKRDSNWTRPKLKTSLCQSILSIY